MEWTVQKDSMLVRDILKCEPFKFKAGSKERGSARSQIAQNLNTYPGFTVSQRTVFVTLSIKETKSKSSVSFKLDVTGKCQGIESFIVKFEFTTKFEKLAYLILYDENLSINKVKNSFDRDTLRTIISALVLTKLFFCSKVWSNTTATNIKKLQAVQNFACRIITKSKKFEHITPALREIKRLPVNEHLLYRHCNDVQVHEGPGPHILM